LGHQLSCSARTIRRGGRGAGGKKECKGESPGWGLPADRGDGDWATCLSRSGGKEKKRDKDKSSDENSCQGRYFNGRDRAGLARNSLFRCDSSTGRRGERGGAGGKEE